MKLPLLVATAIAGACLAQANEDMAKASKIWPQFSNSLYSDDDKARAAFDQLVGISPAVQAKLLDWLDEQYEEKKSDYLREKEGSKIGSSSISSSDKREIRELRKQLEEIRQMKDEAAMKKACKETGWSVLEKLLRLNRSTIKTLDNTRPSTPDPAKAKAILEQLHQVGKYRRELRKKLDKDAPSVEEDIRESTREASKTDEAVTMEMNRRAASILADNEKLKGEIPNDEYKGILELNHWRIAAGMDPLLIDPKLCEASRDHCKDMAKLGFFAHDSPVKGKTTPWDRAKNFGTSARGENIAINNSTEGANQAWFFSPGHHKNMFKEKFSVIGLGIHGRHYCQMFR
ncbi:MAG: CAP domain-containing protein [Akkermansiaceae bacterium]|nr:CAP domain-containing protein [Akkermansiaceae bacterium]